MTDKQPENIKSCKSKYNGTIYNYTINSDKKVLLFKDDFKILISETMFNKLYDKLT